MNCRVMEKKILPKPAVAGILEENYIEARLHTDRPTVPTLKRILELQAKYAESTALPIYVTVDPETERRLGKYEGAQPALSASAEEDYIRFLKDAVAERVGRKD